jgi:hypothetical protein
MVSSAKTSPPAKQLASASNPMTFQVFLPQIITFPFLFHHEEHQRFTEPTRRRAGLDAASPASCPV